MVVEVTESTFDENVLQSNLPVVVDFVAKWCGPCRKLSPILEEIESTLTDKVKIVKIDADANREIMKKYSVSGLPSLLIFKNGEPVERMAGMIPKSTIISNIEKHI